MFSGIVQGTGTLSKIVNNKDFVRLEIIPPKNFSKNLKKGFSVSVDGVCLTSLSGIQNF